MGRKRKLEIGDPDLNIRELVIRHNLDPVDELLKMVKETLPWPDKEFLKENPTWLSALYDKGWENYIDEHGKRRLRMGIGKKTEILCKLAPFMYPTLKSSEHREQKDLRIEVTVKQFGQNSQPRETITVDVPPLLAEEVKKE